MNFFEIHNKHFVPFSFSPPIFNLSGATSGISFYSMARFSHFIDSLRDDLFHLSFLFSHITSLFFVNNIFVHKLKKGDCVQYNKVEICGINTGRLKVLKEKEKMELLKKAQAGDKNARNELVEGNLALYCP